MSSKPFWDLEESVGFVYVTSPIDGLKYKVWNEGTREQKLAVAIELSKIRRDLNKLLLYICKHPEKWINHPIAYGIIHTFDIHMPCINHNFVELVNGSFDNHKNNFINKECSKLGKLFTFQEIAPNEHGIIGLNKPKIIKTITLQYNSSSGKKDYKIADKRAIFLTIRNKKTGNVNDYKKILDLAIHELTHTTCNDVEWKEDNHRPPYQSYHTMMRKWANEAGIM
jgi:hypothetical protein